MELFSVGEIIEQAVQAERLGYEFYTSMARKFNKDSSLRDLFETLALKEQKHEIIFSELRDKEKEAEQENREEVSNYLRAIVESEFFLGRNKSLPQLDHVKTIKDAVFFALNFERDTLLYFHGLRDSVKEKETVDKIIDEEKHHIVWLSEFKMKIK